MAVNTIEPRRNPATTDTRRTPSPAIWADCPWDDINDPRSNIDGVTFFDDFTAVPLPPTLTTQIAYPPWYKAFAISGDSIGPVQAINSVQKQGGFMRFLHASSATSSCSLATLGQPYKLDGLTTTGKLWFEARLAVNSIVTQNQGFFLGLAENSLWTLAAGVPFSNQADAITNAAAAIGFRSAVASLGVVDTVVSDRATSFTNIGAAAVTISAAYTFIKLGMRYDPNFLPASGSPGSACLQFFADNVLLATFYTSTNITATTNLKANGLGLLFSSFSGTVGTAEAYLDWWRVAQVIP